jgi:membrane protease YdiL (CAAX protease family)
MIVAGTMLFYLFVFAGSLVFRTEIDRMLQIPSLNAGIKENMILRYVQLCQQFSLFIIPSLIIIYLIRRKDENFLGMDKFPGLMTILLVIILALSIIPITSFTGVLNSKMNLPDWLSGVEEWMKIKEEDASNITDLLIDSSGFGSMTFNIILLAVIPAFGEELLFRGVLQQLLCRIFRTGHLGIWMTAIIFSTIHFQFFGFLPRLILGLSFGYLFYWSRNLWVPIIAHFVNNAVPVILAYYIGWRELKEKTIYLKNQGIIIYIVLITFCILIFLYFRSGYTRKQRELMNEGNIL